MKIRKTKKGFTIVELVIVVAVIGILAAVLIPTFVNLTNKANETSDDALVKNLNTSLQMAEEEQGKKNDTFQEAIDDLKDFGYLLPNLMTRSDKKLLYRIETNRFVLDSKKEAGVSDVEYWEIVNEIPSEQKYSMYPGTKFSTAITSVDLTVGFDAGERDQFTSITYDRSEATDEGQTAVIRTNSYSTVLTIDAEYDTVTHYGKAKNIDVEAVDNNNCYNEHGDVLGNINLKQGKVVVHEGCKAAAVVIDMTAAELASVTTISADNSKQPNVPIILNTSETLWEANPHNELVDPSKNTIIYSHKGGTLPDNFNTMTDAEKEQAIANAETVEGVAAIQNVTYTSLEEAYEAAEANDTIVLLKDVSYTNNEVFYFCKSITLNGNNKTFTATGNKASYAFYFFNSEGNVAEKAEIKNLTINTTGYQAGILTNDDELTYSNQNILHLNNVTITSQGECIYANGNSHVYASNCNLTRTGKWKAQTGGNEIYYSALIIGYGAKVDFKDSVIVSEGTGVATFPSGGTINVYNTSITVSNPDNAYVHSYAIWSRIGNGSTSVTEYADAGINVFSGDIRGTLNTTDESTIHDSYLIITGGTFDNDPAPYVDSYSYNVSESAGIYTVTAK